MYKYELIVQAGQLKFYIELLEKEDTPDFEFYLISKSKIKATYHVISKYELHVVEQYVSKLLNELKALHYLLQVNQIDI